MQSEDKEMLRSGDDVSPLDDAIGVPVRPIEPPYQGSTVLILILVFLCCFMILLVGIACFSVAWMQKRRKQQDTCIDGSPPGIQANGKLTKALAASASSGLFRWPGLSIGVGGATAPGQSFDNVNSYISIPNTGKRSTIDLLISHISSS